MSTLTQRHIDLLRRLSVSNPCDYHRGLGPKTWQRLAESGFVELNTDHPNYVIITAEGREYLAAVLGTQGRGAMSATPQWHPMSEEPSQENVTALIAICDSDGCRYLTDSVWVWRDGQWFNELTDRQLHPLLGSRHAPENRTYWMLERDLLALLP